MQLARVGAFLGAVTAAVAATVLVATPASAHTPKLSAECEDGTTSLTVELKAYAQSTGEKSNHITITLDGAPIEDEDFGATFEEQTYTAPGDEEHVFVVKVTAHDDKKYSFEEEKTVEACVEEEQPPVDESSSSAPAPTTTTVPTTTETAPVTTSPAAVVPVGEAAPLANTGASIAIPLVIGIVLLGGGVALLVVLRRRAAN